MDELDKNEREIAARVVERASFASHRKRLTRRSGDDNRRIRNAETAEMPGFQCGKITPQRMMRGLGGADILGAESRGQNRARKPLDLRGEPPFDERCRHFGRADS